MTKLTPQEIALLEEETQRLAPGFRIFDLNEFLTVGMAEAQKKLAKKKEVLGGDGETILWPLVVKYVCTDPKREGYGVPFAWWWIFFETSLIRRVILDPWSEARWWVFEELRGKGQTMTMWGGQSTGKSFWMASFTLVMLAAWTKDAIFYITGPKKVHTDDKVWRAITEKASEIAKHPNVFVSVLNLRISSTKSELRVSDSSGTGTAKFVSAEESSTIRGKKSDSSNPFIGIMCVVVDEFVENTNLDLKRINNNAASNANFFQVMAANPDPDLVMHPSIRDFSDTLLTMTLDRTIHFRWETARGLCIRFAWANCPNRALGRSQWGHLLDEMRIKRAQSKGQNTVDAEVDAWGFSGGGRSSILDPQKIKLAGTYEQAVWRGPTRRFIVFDCAFGGQDPATAWIAEAGAAMFRARNGDAIEKSVISSIEQTILPVASSFTVTQEWLDEMQSFMDYTGGEWPGGAEKAPIPGMTLYGNYHMGYLAAKAMVEYEIPRGNYTFDTSQRADCSDIMKAVLGAKELKWAYEGSRSIKQEEDLTPGWWKFPLEYERQNNSTELVPKKWSDSCSSSISMLWMFAAEVIKHGMLCNGDTCQRGLDELVARPIVKRRGTAEGKKDVLGKEELKKMGVKSPSFGETIAMGIYFAIRFLNVIQLDAPKSTVTVKAKEPFLFLSAGKRSFSRFR